MDQQTGEIKNYTEEEAKKNKNLVKFEIGEIHIIKKCYFMISSVDLERNKLEFSGIGFDEAMKLKKEKLRKM